MHDRRPWIVCFAVLLGSWLLCAAPAAADPTSPDDGCLRESVCRERYELAMKLFESGHFEAALPEFQAAYQRRQMPWLLINIGRTLHRLGRPRQALEYYDRFKQTENKPDAEALERVEQYSAAARALLDTAAKDATVPLPGSEGQNLAKPDPSVEPPPAPPVVTTAPPPPEPVKPAAKPVYKKWWFWTLIGGGVVAAATVGIVVGTVVQSSPSLPSGVPTIMFKL